MPLYEVEDGTLKTPLRVVAGGAELYEREIEDLAWSDLEAMTGEPLFPVARQATLPGGGRPDVLALDRQGRVVVIEIKRDVDRSQLAQTLEYAGWARTTSLDELAGMYHRDHRAFFADWQEYTESTTPVLVNRAPRLILIARDFQARTQAALTFLKENGLPVTVIPVTVYEHPDGRRFVDVESGSEPPPAAASEPTSGSGAPAKDELLDSGRRVQIGDLLETGLLMDGETLEFRRPRLGHLYTAIVRGNGSIEVDGVAYSSPSSAATAAAKAGSFDGWHVWSVPRAGGVMLNELRLRYLQAAKATAS